MNIKAQVTSHKTQVAMVKTGTLCLVSCVLCLGGHGGAIAQPYPSKPVRFVLPYPPGGGSDTIGRPLAQKMSEGLGQQVVVENRGGASGNIGMEYVARSAPDG